MNYHVFTITQPLTDRSGSYRTAWVKMRQLQEEFIGNKIIMYKKYTDIDTTKFTSNDMLVVYLGFEWNGIINLFTGLTAQAAETIRWPTDFDFLFLDRSDDMLKVVKRRKNNASKEWLDLFENENMKKYKNANIIYQPKFTDLVIGDSYALVWFEKPYQNVFRYDGKTLHGALNDKLISFIHTENPTSITFCFGDNDIRLHLCRQDDPLESASLLLMEYHKQLLELKQKYSSLKIIRLTACVPIYSELRKMSKTVSYKGRTYWGSWKDRHSLKEYINNQNRKFCFSHGFEFLEYPEYFSDENGMLLEKYMEKPRGVHISWEFGLYNRTKN